MLGNGGLGFNNGCGFGNGGMLNNFQQQQPMMQQQMLLQQMQMMTQQMSQQQAMQNQYDRQNNNLPKDDDKLSSSIATNIIKVILDTNISATCNFQKALDTREIAERINKDPLILTTYRNNLDNVLKQLSSNDDTHTTCLILF